MDVRANNRPHPPSAQAQSAAPRPIAPPPSSDTTRRVITAVAVAVVLVAAVIAGVWMWYQSKSSEGSIKGDRYQALFLTNNQVYFGHLKNVDDKYVVMSEVYYLQVQQAVQPQKDSAQQSPQQASLSKLGSEVHGPEDTMYIARDQVLFWENLKADSKVVQAIKEYQKK